MSDELTPEVIETLKSRFRGTGCKVVDLEGATFEIVGSDFPLRTHVSVNPYYVQLATFIIANPQGFLPGRKSKIHEFLSDINVRAKLVKFTMEADKPDPEKGGWPIFASVKFVTGVAGGDYETDAIGNLVKLWYQDMAELIASPGACELSAMMQDEGE